MEQENELVRQTLFNGGIFGFSNNNTRKARDFLNNLVQTGVCRNYHFTHGESFQSYAERTLQSMYSAYYKILVKWIFGSIFLVMVIYGFFQKNRDSLKQEQLKNGGNSPYTPPFWESGLADKLHSRTFIAPFAF